MNTTKNLLLVSSLSIVGCNGNLEFRQMEQACEDKGGVYNYPNTSFE